MTLSNQSEIQNVEIEGMRYEAVSFYARMLERDDVNVILTRKKISGE